jgi:hypothetical protein
LPESFEARCPRFLPLRRRIEPVSPEFVRKEVLGLSDYGRCAFGSGFEQALSRFSRLAEPPSL